jgi:hypothetical protein
MMEGPGAESEEKREPASDIETAAVDSLKCLTQIGRLEKQTSFSTVTVSTLCQYQKSLIFYSITSSAVASSVGGMVSPSALAVARLIAVSNLVGACTGRSAGFEPRRIRST